VPRRRYLEFLLGVSAPNREFPAGKTMHAILDNLAARKTLTMRRCPERHLR